ncbi:long-chain-fatty-acid--CoA ligase [Neobacillus niacini]|uniref:class I adenylate-forming enzyme family protein n=1 Tax=Neobacillus niacini TaxID=86668 RepID=UPI0030001CFE
MELVSSIVEKQARLIPDKHAIIDDSHSKKITYSQLFKRSKRFANALLDMGLQPGDRVAMILSNSYVSAELIYGITMAGMVMVNINERLREQEIKYILNDSNTKVIVTSSEITRLLNNIDVPALKYTISINGGICDYLYESLLENSCDQKPNIKMSIEDIALLLYTSGTTGIPKGVPLSHKNLLTSAMNFVIEAIHNPNGSYLAVMPYHHIVCVPHMAAILRGMRVVVSKFEVNTVLELVEKYKITHAFLVPSMITMLLESNQIEQYDTSSLEMILYAAAPMPVEILKKALKRFGAIFCQFYGSTETASITTILRKDEHILNGTEEWTERLASCGREILNTSIKIVNENGEEVEIGEPGEIIVKGDNVMKNYFNFEQTQEAVKDGWFYTGDIGKFDHDRFIYIVDRKKDMIISGGFNIYPREIEETLYTHPAVYEASVVGIPEKIWGESVLALVVLKPGFVVTEDEIIDFCKKQIASYKKPSKVKFIDVLPRNDSGKINKVALRKKYWEGHNNSVI